MPHTNRPTLADVLSLASQLSLPEQLQLIDTLRHRITQALAVDHTAKPAPPESQTTRSRTSSWGGPVVLREAPKAVPDDDIVSNGLDPATGEPLLTLDLAAARRIAAETSDPKEGTAIQRARERGDEPTAGLVHGFDEDDLNQAGWALVVNSKEQASLLKALSPLIVWRCQQQGLAPPDLTFRDGEDCGTWLARHADDLDRTMYGSARIPLLLYYPGESCIRWLARHHTWPSAVDPRRGVPFYLMLVGRPGARSEQDQAYIPFDFQYELDMFWGVGRLCFTDLNGEHIFEHYTAYAEQLIAFEQAATPPYQKRVHFFGTRHVMDRATQESATQLLTPLHAGFDGKGSVAQRWGFEATLSLGTLASKDTLAKLLQAGDDQRPALLMSATHGIGMAATDPQLPAYQGALVCADWQGTGNVNVSSHCFSAFDLPASTNVTGMLAVAFACYSAGCPATSEISRTPFEPPLHIAPRALISQLPQQLLARGALAVLGHVDKGLSTTFTDDSTKVVAQTQAFEDVLGRLLDNKRIGYATDQFNLYQAALAVQLSELLVKYQFAQVRNPDFGIRTIGPLWAAYRNARNFLVIGDPAVRLPFSLTAGCTGPQLPLD